MANGAWIYQGRQYHQWFGHGTAPTGGDRAAPATLDERMAVLAATALASVPRAQRNHPALQPGQAWHAPFKAAMRAWVGDSAQPAATFAQRLFGAKPDAPGMASLQAAAREVATAKRQRDMWRASDHLADAMGALTLAHWPRFVTTAAARATSVPDAAVQTVQYRRTPPGAGNRGAPTLESLSTAELIRTERYNTLVRQITEIEPGNPRALGIRNLNTAPSAQLVAKLESELLAAQIRLENTRAPFVTTPSLFVPEPLNPSGKDRGKAGEVHTSNPLQPAGPSWFTSCFESGAPVPAQVARAMDGRTYANFDNFRGQFWVEVSKVPELASQFSVNQLLSMRRGSAPRLASDQAKKDCWRSIGF